MTRHESCQLFSILIALRLGDTQLAIKRLRAMREASAAEHAAEDTVNAALERIAQETANDHKQRPV